MLDSFSFAAAVSECEVETTVRGQVPRLSRSRPTIPRSSSRGARSSAPASSRSEVEVGGGADANVFNERGLHCVNVANGMANVHTAEEAIAVADLEAMVAVTLELVAAAREA